MKINITGIKIDRYSLDEIVEKIIDRAISLGPPEYVITPNAHHALVYQQDAHFRDIYSNAFLVVPDGMSIVWAAKFLKTPLKGRVNGTDLFEKLCEASAGKDLKIFLLGGRPEAALLAAKAIKQRYPSLKIAGTYCPKYGFESDRVELKKINDEIFAAKPQILFVGLGAPKQENWIFENYQKLGIPISIGIGVSFELVGGIVKRSPIWMQKIGLEWSYRLAAEPTRLWKRYILGNPIFIWLVIKQRLGILKFK